MAFKAPLSFYCAGVACCDYSMVGPIHWEAIPEVVTLLPLVDRSCGLGNVREASSIYSKFKPLSLSSG